MKETLDKQILIKITSQLMDSINKAYKKWLGKFTADDLRDQMPTRSDYLREIIKENVEKK